jgi:hypothetical protein
MSEHTIEPWAMVQGFNKKIGESLIIVPDGAIIGKEYEVICLISDMATLNNIDKANARRIVACVNACAGVPIEALEHLKAGDLSEMFFDHWDAD